MNTTELLAVIRQEVFDTVAPYLWADSLIYTYIDDAQKQFCRDTRGIEDSRSFSFAIKPGVQWYALDSTILKVRSAVNSVTGDDIDVLSVEKMPERGLKFDSSTGIPRAFVIGLEKGYVRSVPIPFTATPATPRSNSRAYAIGALISLTNNGGTVGYYICTTPGTSAAAQGALYPGVSGEVITDGTARFTDRTASLTMTYNIRAYRLPNDVAAGDEFEIDDHHVLNLASWVKYRMYSVQDTETRDDKKAMAYKADFAMYCKNASDEQGRLHRPVSTVTYGGY